MNIIPSTKRVGMLGCLIAPQNGVVDGRLHYGPGTDRQIAMGPSIDTLNGTAGSIDATKRPKNLSVVSQSAYGGKSLREDSGDVEDSSLPCTPEQSISEATVSGSAAGDDILDNDTRQLISRFLTDFTGLSEARWNESKALSTLKRVADDVLKKHRYAYNGMINKLSLDDRGDDVTFVGAVAKSLFADGTTNWGRIVSLVAFGAVVCQQLKERGRANCVDLVGQEISTYLLAEQRDWLVKNNSWDGFVEFFQVADPESTFRNTLMTFAGFAGIGATLALLIR